MYTLFLPWSNFSESGLGPTVCLCVCVCPYIYGYMHVLAKSGLLSVCMLLSEKTHAHMCVKKVSSAAEHSGN